MHACEYNSRPPGGKNLPEKSDGLAALSCVAVKLKSISTSIFAPARAIYCGLSALLILGAFWSVRMAQADYDAAQPDLPHVTSACQLAATSANYWLKAASLREVDEPSDRVVDASLQRALVLNPRSSEAWLARAVRNETHWNIAEAERDYLTAASVDHMYKPAWALANFYLRQQATDKFWLYARKCLEVVEPRRLEPFSYNPAPVFDLAWRVTRNAAEIRRKLIPPRHFILVDYLEYLGEHNQPDAGADVAIDLAGFADPSDNYYLLNFCDRLIHLSNASRAVDIWNAMVARGMLQGERLDPEHGQSLTNGALKRPFERIGFDWRLPPAEGVAQNHFPDSGEVRFDFTGDQPEGVLPLYQAVPVVGGRAYRLTFRYRTAGMQHCDGLSWQVWDYAGQRLIPVACMLSPHQEWSAGEAGFVIPTGVSMARLGLLYQRATGSTRIAGTVAFTGFALRLADEKVGLRWN